MTDVMKTLYGSRITLLMEVFVVHKLVNYAFLFESFCALFPSRDRSSCVLQFSTPYHIVGYTFLSNIRKNTNINFLFHSVH